MTLRRKIQLLLFSVAAATAIIVGLFSYSTITQEMEQSKLQSLDVLAASRATAVSLVARSWEKQILLVSSRTRLREQLDLYNQQPLDEYRNRIRNIIIDAGKSIPGILKISVHALDGTLVAEYGEQIEDEISADYLIRQKSNAADSTRPQLFALRPGRDGKVRAEHRGKLLREGVQVGTVQVAMDATELAIITTEYSGLGETGEVLIAKRAANDDALFVAPTRSDPNAAFQKRIPAEGESIPSTQAVEGEQIKHFHRYRDYQNTPIIAVTRYLPEIDGGLVAKIDRSEAAREIDHVQGLIGLVTTVVLILAMGVAARLTNSIVKPIEELGLVVKKIRDNDFSARATVHRSDEIGVLAGSVNDMADALGRSSGLIRESEERFRSAFDDSAIGMALVTTHGGWARVNHALCHILGYTDTELLQTDFQSITHPDDLGEDLELVEQLLAGKIEKYTLNKRYFHKDGHVVLAKLNVSLVRDSDGAPVHFVSQIEDITEEEATKDALSDSNTQLQRSNQELEDFAYTASHDLKEPLRTISNFSMFLEEDYSEKVDADGLKMMQMMRAAASRLEGLIDELLKFSRAGRAELHIELVDLNEIIESLDQELKVMLEEKAAEIKIAQKLPVVYCDRIRIVQILQNLVSNAIKYNDSKKPQVEIGFRDESPPVITIQDNGIGIPPEHREKIFRIFKRLHARDEYGGGHGAGLTIVKKLIELHGGKIWAEPVGESEKQRQGTIFCFTLAKAKS